MENCGIKPFKIYVQLFSAECVIFVLCFSFSYLLYIVSLTLLHTALVFCCYVIYQFFGEIKLTHRSLHYQRKWWHIYLYVSLWLLCAHVSVLTCKELPTFFTGGTGDRNPASDVTFARDERRFFFGSFKQRRKYDWEINSHTYITHC